MRAPAQNLSREVVWALVSIGFQPAFTNLHHRTTTVVEARNPMAHSCTTAGSGATVAVLLLTHLEKPLGLCVLLRALSVCWSLSLQPERISRVFGSRTTARRTYEMSAAAVNSVMLVDMHHDRVFGAGSTRFNSTAAC